MKIDCCGKILDITEPKVRGILNFNPDSFYDGGKFDNIKSALDQIELMLLEGASIIDIGGMSSKPGSEIIASEDEQARLIPLLKEAVRIFPDALFSIDTIHAATATKALDLGAKIINDISAATFDKEMLSTVFNYDAVLILMHMRGTPANMQNLNHYDDLMSELCTYFQQRIEACHQLGQTKLIIDPGFGFAKNLNQNFHLLRNMATLKSLNIPILAGLSRKSMIYKTLGTDATAALNGTTALNMLALQNGANILRVHDVKEAVETIKLFQAYTKA